MKKLLGIAVVALLMFAPPIANTEAAVMAPCVINGENAAGCMTWTSCNGGLVAYVQQLCEIDDGVFVWGSYYMPAMHAGCGACEQ